MADWCDIEGDAPDYAARVQRRFEVGINKTIATLRRDGSPRISATELEFKGGQVTLGMMGGSMKLLDVRRDPRVAIHSPTIEALTDTVDWPGDAKLAGTLVETPVPENDPHPGAGFFRLDITEVTLTYVRGEELVIESWHAGRGRSLRARK